MPAVGGGSSSRKPDDGARPRAGARGPGGETRPELGPRLLFFSGGSALRRPSRALKRYSHNTIHLITPFDSGGSSARLREAFDMLSVGDLRSRMVALADETVPGNPEVYRLFRHRLGSGLDRPELARSLEALAAGTDPRVEGVPGPLRGVIRAHLGCFRSRMPAGFDLRGASVGNLVLVGGFLHHGRDIDAVIRRLSGLATVRGTVRPVTDASLHLQAELESGERVVGQHRITGKEVAPIASPIRDLRLVRGLADSTPAAAAVGGEVRGLIAGADLICYPMGSFWTSVVANLLPSGVGRAVCAAERPKVYVPNVGRDPEQLGTTVGDRVRVLHRRICADAGGEVPVERAVSHVLVDSTRGDYDGGLDLERVRALGVEVIDLPLVTEESRPLIATRPLAEALLSLA